MGSMECFSTGDDLVCTTIRSYFIKWSEIKELFLTSHIPQDTLCPISLSILELARRSGYYVGNFSMYCQAMDSPKKGSLHSIYTSTFPCSLIFYTGSIWNDKVAAVSHNPGTGC